MWRCLVHNSHPGQGGALSHLPGKAAQALQSVGFPRITQVSHDRNWIETLFLPRAQGLGNAQKK